MLTMSPTDRRAACVTSVSGVAAAKLPPSATMTFASSSRMARIELTTSRPRSRGDTMPNSASRASPKCGGSFSQMPIVRSPWTLE